MQIYEHLQKNPDSSVTAIVSILRLTQPTVSYHLHEMQQAGLLVSDKKGKEIHYRINLQCPVDAGTCVLCLLNKLENG